MHKSLLLQSALSLVLAVTLATVRERIERALILSEHPRSEVPRMYVGRKDRQPFVLEETL